MFLLGILDFLFVSHAYHSILTRGASVQLVFGFEVKLVWGIKDEMVPCGCEQSYKCFLRTCCVSTPLLATREPLPFIPGHPHIRLGYCKGTQIKAGMV